MISDMRTKQSHATVDHFRFHLGFNTLCFAVPLGLGIAYAYFAFSQGNYLYQTLSLLVLAVEIVAFVLTLIGLANPNRFTYGAGGKGKKRYEDFTAKEKRDYVSSTYALWGLLGVVVIVLILTLAFKQ